MLSPTSEQPIGGGNSGSSDDNEEMKDEYEYDHQNNRGGADIQSNA